MELVMKRAIINAKIASFSTFNHTPLEGEYMYVKYKETILANPSAVMRAAKIAPHRANRSAAKQILSTLKNGQSEYLQIGSNVYKLNAGKTAFEFFVHFE